MRPEPLEERRKRLAKLLSRKTKVMRDGTQVSEAITGLERVVPMMDEAGVDRAVIAFSGSPGVTLYDSSVAKT